MATTNKTTLRGNTMNIKELTKFEDLKRNIVEDAIKILNMRGSMDERYGNYKRFNDHIRRITGMFPDSTFIKEKNRDFLLKMICDPCDVLNHFDCENADPIDVSNFIATNIKNKMEDISKGYKENYLDFE